jgi:hypothetical protein
MQQEAFLPPTRARIQGTVATIVVVGAGMGTLAWKLNLSLNAVSLGAFVLLAAVHTWRFARLGIIVRPDDVMIRNYMHDVRIPKADLVCFLWSRGDGGVRVLRRHRHGIRSTRVTAFNGRGAQRWSMWLDMWRRTHRDLETARLEWTTGATPEPMVVAPGFHLAVYIDGGFGELPPLGRAYVDTIATILSEFGGALFVEGAGFSVSTQRGAWWALVNEETDDVLEVVADPDAEAEAESFVFMDIPSSIPRRYLMSEEAALDLLIKVLASGVAAIPSNRLEAPTTAKPVNDVAG